MPVHRVRAGESIDSIALVHGHFPETIWAHPDNAELAATRESRTVLAEGDLVHVPALRPKQVVRPTNARHRFRRRGVPAQIRIKLMTDRRALADCPWRLEVPGAPVREGSSRDGLIETFVPPEATRGTLWWGTDGRRIELRFGQLDPISTTRGRQQRLTNLGYPTGPIDGEANERTREALLRFQLDLGLAQTGEFDHDTLARLAQLHDRGQDFPNDSEG